MNELEKLIKPNVLNLSPYTSARDDYKGRQGIFLDANENPYNLSYNRYPDPYQVELKEKISQWRDVNKDHIFLGNGSDEVIDLLIRATCRIGKDKILSLDPSYGMYKVSAAVNDIAIELVGIKSNMEIDEDNLFSKLNDEHKLIFICSPNNPNGGLVPEYIIERILDSTDNLVVVDEAYIDFSASNSWVEHLKTYDNLVVLQTFSKSLGAAGIRLGIGFMNPFLVGILNKIKPPYNISKPNQEIAINRLTELDKISDQINDIIKSRNTLTSDLNTLPIVDYIYPSNANFLLVRFLDHQLVFSTLIDHKIIVRDRSMTTNCEGCLRITIGTDAENQKLLEILKSIK